MIEATFPDGAWSADASSYLYLRTDAVNRPFQVWAHRLGTNPTSDRLLFEEPDQRFELTVEATRSGSWLVITAASRDTSEVHLLPAADPTATPMVVRPREPGVEYRVEHAPGPGGDRLLIVTNLDAVEFRVAVAPIDAPGRWSEVIAEDPSVRIHRVDAFASAIVLSARKHGVGMVMVRPHHGEPFEIWPSVSGGLVRLGRNETFDADSATIVEQSFIAPTRHDDVDLATGSRVLRHIETVIGVDPDSYVQQRELAEAPDGTRVPVVVVRHREVALDGTAPLFLYGYGSYEACTDPDFGYDWWRALPSLLDR
ncbi:MAG: oligopeptidase B, partial [Mycobacteriaceae bacterium]|nr:oligopeptidase B [Mycobacteriaceae bacterium]